MQVVKYYATCFASDGDDEWLKLADDVRGENGTIWKNRLVPGTLENTFIRQVLPPLKLKCKKYTQIFRPYFFIELRLFNSHVLN